MRKLLLLALAVMFVSSSVCGQTYGDLERATINVAADIGKSVVSISSVVKEKMGERLYFGSPFGRSENDPFRHFFEEFFGSLPEKEFKRMGLGSGVIIDKEGYILTNEHVVGEASEVKVKLADGREFDAVIKGVDKRSDLAVIKIEATDLPAVRLGDSDELKIGSWVVAAGNPFGFAIENPEPTITVGVVSALNRYVPALGRRERSYDDLIQTDAAINPGNSGGPLVNLNGEVIGINTAIITVSGGYQGLGFAIPINKAKVILNKLIKGEKILYGWLGVTIQDLNDDLRNYFGVKEKKGVIVIQVTKDSPAERAGFKEGDLILTFDGKPIKTTRDLIRMVSATEVGRVIPSEILRNAKRLTLKVKIGERPEDIEALQKAETLDVKKAIFRGLGVEDITSYTTQKYNLTDKEGVVVTYIDDDSPASRSGLKVGDVISKIEGKRIHSKRSFTSIASKIKGNCLVKTNRGYFVIKEK